MYICGYLINYVAENVMTSTIHLFKRTLTQLTIIIHLVALKPLLYSPWISNGYIHDGPEKHSL